MIWSLIFIPFFSFASCKGLFDSHDRKNQIIRDTIEQYKNNPQESLGDFIKSLTALEIMDNFSFSPPPEYAQFFTVEQLRPDYMKIGKEGTKKKGRGNKAGSDRNSARMSRAHSSSIRLIPNLNFNYLPPEKIRTLDKSSASYEAYGPLPHLPPDCVPYLQPSVITGLRKSIRYLSDKIQYMTEEQIQALDLDQIYILSEELQKTGKNADLSSEQILAVMRKSPKLFTLLRASTHNEILAEELFHNIDDRKFFIGNIPIDIVKYISSDRFYLSFLQTLRKKSYSHFLSVSPQQVDGMRLDLRQYVVMERWKVFLRKPQEKMRFRNLSIEKVTQMDEEDRREVFTKMNLSEDSFMSILGEERSFQPSF